MKSKIAYFAVFFLVASLIISGCTSDMDIRNDNNPDTKRVIVTPEDVESLISSAFRLYWFAANGFFPANTLCVLGDVKSTSWG
ncbi:hypothetical protein ACFL6O_00135 [candidate division KSB1 bacterium]